MAAVHPLIFTPLFRPKVWGGRNLERLLAKRLPPNEPIGESWECADLDEGQSVVAAGPLTGRTLHQLVEEWGTDLLGRAPLAGGRFPLLIKFLDAVQPLSVQVHPDAATAAAIGGAARPKEEMFYVIDAAPDGFIYNGLRPGTTRDDLAEAVGTNEVDTLLQRIPARPGQSFHVPPGTLHALGRGVVVAEVETPSDTTYRLYDWGRTRTGKDAGLHVEQALRSVRFDAAPSVRPRSHVGGLFTTVTRLVECPAFIVEKVRFVEGMEMEIPYAELVVWIVLTGRGAVHYSPNRTQPFSTGDVVVLPAALKDGKVKTETDCVWLEVTVPVASDLAGLPHPDAQSLRAREGTTNAPLAINIDLKNKPPPTR